MAFVIKGQYYYHSTTKSPEHLVLLKTFANRLVQMYKHESVEKWEWFEGYLTYANSILPEAMLYAWLLTGDTIYRDIARTSFNFLLSQTFNENGIEVISNKNWLQKGQEAGSIGEQPIDVAYTIMTLSKFYDVFMDEDYRLKMETAFNWFLGSNRLHQIIVPLGDWEKNPRLQAKTLVCLRYGELPEIKPHRLRHKISQCQDHEIQQADFES